MSYWTPGHLDTWTPFPPGDDDEGIRWKVVHACKKDVYNDDNDEDDNVKDASHDDCDDNRKAQIRWKVFFPF